MNMNKCIFLDEVNEKQQVDIEFDMPKDVLSFQLI